MISVVIPTLDAEASLAATLAPLVSAAVNGLVKEVIVVDGGSSDRTKDIADLAGARLQVVRGGRGAQLAAGGEAARFPWLLFLHADTVLEDGWDRDAAAFMDRIEGGRRPPAAAAFRFALDDTGARARVLERLVAVRASALRLPYGDQGLLLPRTLYRKIGGFRPMPLMEDVDLVRRLGRRRVAILKSRAVTSAERFHRDGYVRRSARNLVCLTLFTLRVPPHMIQRIYG